MSRNGDEVLNGGAVYGRRLATRRDVLTGAAKLAGGGALAMAGIGGTGAWRTVLAQDGTPEAGMATPGAAGALDADMQEVIDQLVAFGAPPIESQTPFNARQLPGFPQAVQAVLAARGEPGLQPIAAIDHILIPGPAGEIVARVYTPEGTGPFPVLVYFHGGGFVLGNLDTYDASCRALANAVPCVVVQPAYRLAPENPFPAAVDDAYAVTQYLMTNGGEVNGDPARVAVGGESAGGNLATVVCLRARGEGGAMPVHQLLVYPLTTLVPEGEALETIEANANAMPLNAAMLDWFGGYYAPSDADKQNPDASPMLASDLSGLPPATVITATVDPLLGQGRLYAEALEQAGVDTTYTNYDGVTHEFFGGAAVIAKAQQAQDEAAARLREAFGETA